MKRIAVLAFAALAVVAASSASPGPVVTRGSAAVPAGCDPAAAAVVAAAHAAGKGRTLVYAEVVPSRELDAGRANLRAAVTGADGTFAVDALLDCVAGSVLSWSERTVPAVTSPGSCPVPPDWRSGEPVVACAALPTAWETSADFTVRSTSQSSGSCGGVAVRSRVLSLLHALDYGRAHDVAQTFDARGTFRPYSATLERPLAGRAAIERFAKVRVAAADGWTATRLLGPLDRTRTTASYRVTLTAYASGLPTGAGNANVQLDCRTGLIRSWSGPALPLPG